MFSVRHQTPSPRLRPFVQFYVQRELTLRDPLFVQAVPARAAPMLEFIFGDRFTVRYRDTGREDLTPRVVLVGMQTRPFAELRLQGSLVSFIVMFQPTGLDALFGLPPREVIDHDHDARAVLGPMVDELDRRLGDCRTLDERIAATEVFLTWRAARAARPDRLAMAVRQMLAADGCVRIPDVAAWTGLGARQCERAFHDRFGMRPKLLARIIRFQAALDRKARSATKTWADIAQEFGYADQMHMIHDFRQFTGERPTETLRLVEMLFREQIAALRTGLGLDDASRVPRFMV